MNCRFAVSVLIVLALGMGPATAQSSGELSSFALLRMDVSARAGAFGGSYAAVADGDANAFFYNPSISGPATSRTGTVSYLNHLSDINAGSFAYNRTLRGLGTTVSGGVRFVHWGTFEGRTEAGEQTGAFRESDVALTLGTARPLGARARYGANVHLLHAQIETERATAVATNLGALYRVPAHQLTLGLSLRNVGLSVDGFGREEESLPLDLQLGLSKRLTHLPLLLSLTAYDLTQLEEGIDGGTTVDHILAHLTVGGELQLVEVLRLRGGYNHRRSRELALSDRFDLAGFGMGVGLVVDGISLDYALNSWSDLGELHQFTLQADLTSL